MRVSFELAAGLGLVALAVGTSWSAPPTQSTPMTVPAGSVSELKVAPGSNDVRQSKPLAGVEALTANECTQLGGSVWTSYGHICASGKMCRRVDNYGVLHSVCLSKAVK